MKTTYFSKLSFAFLVGFGAATALTSCSFEDEDYFDQPAALRIEQATTDIQKILVDAPNGWVMQYFTGMNEVEGFNLLARFDQNGKVTLGSNHRYLRDGNANKYTEATSLYQMLREDGPVLAFNTWNEILTPFIDPVDYKQAPRVLVKDGEGMHGDHNLVVTSYSKDEILLRGERYGAIVRMVPCPTESWQDYISTVAAMRRYITSNDTTNFAVSNGDTTLYFKNLNSGVITYCERINDPLFPTTINCVFTPSGLRLHRVNNIGGTTFQEFRMSPDSTCLLSENDSVRLTAIWQPNVMRYLRTAADKSGKVFNLDYASLSAEQKGYYDAIRDGIGAMGKNYAVKSISLASTTAGSNITGLIVTFVRTATQKDPTVAGLSMKFQMNADYSYTISYDDATATSNNNMKTICRSAEVDAAVRALAASLVGHYTLTPNNYFVPTSVTFAPVGAGSTFTLTRTE